MSAQPEWLLERALLGEAPGDFVPDSSALDRLRASNAEILDQLPPRAVAAEVERRRTRSSKSWSRAPFWIGGVAVVAAVVAALLFVLFARGDRQHVASIDPAEKNDGIRIKGNPRVIIHRKHHDHAAILDHQAIANPSDLLQLSYFAAGRQHGAILSIDGRGATTLHFPDSPRASTALVRGRTTPLSHAYRLDDAPRFERFIFVTSATPIDPAVIIAAAERIANTPDAEKLPLPLPPALEQFSILLRKTESL